MIKKIVVTILSYLVLLFFLLLSFYGNFFDTLFGLVIIIYVIGNVLLLLRNKDFVSPRIFEMIFILTFGLFELRLSTQINAMNFRAKCLIIFSMFIWRIICDLLQVNEYSEMKDSFFLVDLDMLLLKRIVLFLFIISMLAMFFEWYKFGEIPAFSKDLEIRRFEVSYNAEVHLLAVMQRIISVLLFVLAYFTNRKRYAFLGIFSLLLLTGLGARAEVLYPILIIFVFAYLMKPFRIKTISTGFIVIMVIVGFVPIYRQLSSFGVSYISDLKRISSYPNIFFLTPLYESFAYNLNVFNLDFNSFPKVVPFGLGKYSILSSLPFLNLGLSLTKVQNNLLGQDFYAGLASTYMGSLYADFGSLGVLFFTAVYGVLICFVYNRFMETRKVSWALVYSYLLYGIIMGFYHYVFDQVFVFYFVVLIVIILLCKRRIN